MTPEGTPRADGSAFCVAHRLRYDPQLHVGCVVCQRALAPTAAPRPASRGLLAPLLFGAWFGVVAAFGVELWPLVFPRPEAQRADLSLANVAHAARVPAGEVAPGEGRAQFRPVTSAQEEPANQPRAVKLLPPLPKDAPKGGLSGAAVRGDLAGITAELDAHSPIDAQDGLGRSALIWAILGQRPDAARLLIERGANVDQATYASDTPLMLAAAFGLEAVSALLLERGANVTDATPEGVTVLMRATESSHIGVLESVLAHHPSIEARDDNGRSALARAAQVGAAPEMIVLLLAHGAAIEARDIHGQTPLLHAVARGREANVATLLDRGAAIDARANSGWSALDFVVQPRAGINDRQLAELSAELSLLIRHDVDPRLTIDAARNEILLRPALDSWYARIGWPPLPAFRGQARAQGGGAQQGSQLLDSPATVLLFEPKNLHTDTPSPTAPSALIGYRGWTRVPEIKARVVLKGVSLYGAQQATLCGYARGDGDWHIEDALLLELMQDGQLIDMGFVGAADGVEVAHAGVRRMGDPGYDHMPGTVDLTPWLSVDGRELVLTILAASKHIDITEIYLRVNGAGARRTVERAEVDRSGQGGTL